MTEPTAGWRKVVGDIWTSTQPGSPGCPECLLRVCADPSDEDEPWTWEVVTLDGEAEQEIDVGGAASREAAMAAAVARAAAYAQDGE